MECLESLANTECFSILQNKLNKWTIEYNNRCTEANISYCCELLELNAKIQGQLFKLLGLSAMQGDFRGSDLTIKNRLRPYLGDEYLSKGLTVNTVMDILNDVKHKTKRLSLKSIDGNQRHLRSRSSSNGRSNTREISDNLDKLKVEPEVKNKSQTQQIKIVKHPKPRSRSHEQIINHDEMKQSNYHGDFGGSDIENIRKDTYLQQVVGQYNDLFSESRANSMNILSRYIDDHQNNQRILFALIITAAKHVAEEQRSSRKPYGSKSLSAQKLEFRKPISYSILKGLRAKIIYEMLKNRGSHFHFRISQKFKFVELEDFINRTIELFWKFGGVRNGLQLCVAADGELFDEHRYRRSYDSDCNAPLVNHHIWPCLTMGLTVLVKGEACTRASSKLVHSRNIHIPDNPTPKRHYSK